METNKSIKDSLVIRGHKIKNRISIPPMYLAMNWDIPATDGMVTEEQVERYRTFAHGGAGLIVQEGAAVLPDGTIGVSELGCWKDEQIPGLAHIADAVHGEGGIIVGQLHHAGAVSISETPVSSSEYFCRKTGKTARAMRIEEIEAMTDAFAAGAERLCRAGYDGVELHGAHGFIFSQFFNSRINKRTDHYAAPMEFVSEILAKIRARVPDDFIVGIRMGAYEPTLADGIMHAQKLEEMGIDFIDVSYGTDGDSEPYCPESWNKYADVIWAAGEIKKKVSVPVFAVYGICTRQEAEEVLALTDVDMVDVGRSSVVDPEWANKVLTGVTPGKCYHCKECRAGNPQKCAGMLSLKKQQAAL